METEIPDFEECQKVWLTPRWQFAQSGLTLLTESPPGPHSLALQALPEPQGQIQGWLER